MKTFKNKNRFVNFQKVSLFVLFSPVLIFVFKNSVESSENKTQLFAFSRNSKPFLDSFRAFQVAEGQASTEQASSIFSKIFSGIGAFFAFVGKGFATGVTKTFKFLGQAIIFPVTATISLFSSRSPAGSDSKGSEDSRRR